MATSAAGVAERAAGRATKTGAASTGADWAGSPSIRITAARKHFKRGDGTEVPAVDGIDLTVQSGEFVVLLGPSGCGKTTLLRSLAGLEDLDSGSIEVQGRVLFDKAKKINIAPERRNIGMMFQSYALWPHLTVEKNVSYPLVSQKLPKADIVKRVKEILDIVGIENLKGQYPTQLSGGQQQRVALARALVSGHGVVLFDEPLSNVDARVRDHLRTELQRLHRELGFTAVYVTHDQDEALALATTVTVLNQGRVAQSARPREVYREPATPYVARFMGSANEIAGTVASTSGGGATTGGVTVLDTAIGPVIGLSPHAVTVGQKATAFIRPENLELSAALPGDENAWQGRLASEFFHGFYSEQVFAIGDVLLRSRGLDATAATDSASWLHASPSDVRILTETPGELSDVAPGEPAAAAELSDPAEPLGAGIAEAQQ